MDTSAIVYRVAEFLKSHPPFSAMDEPDLLEFASRGRVRFHEAHDYILWQGEPNRFKVFVIQQGAVELWDERGERSELRDVRGVGDMLGMEQFAGANSYTYSARSAADVLLYVFSSFDFEALVLKYPVAQRFVAAYESVTADYHVLDQRREPQKLFLHDLVGHRPHVTCDHDASLRDAARIMRASDVDALAVVDAGRGLTGVLTADQLIAWIAGGAGDVHQPVSALLAVAPPTAGPHVTVADGLLTMAAAGESVLAITADGTPQGQLHAVVTQRELAPVFGDQPAAILREIRQASGTRELRVLNHRVRAFALQYLTSGTALDWIARFVHLADVGIVRRLVALNGHGGSSACWCVCGSSGREESLTRLAPLVVLIHADGDTHARDAHQRVWGACTECDYLPRQHLPFESPFYVGGFSEWISRYTGWFDDPVMSAFYRTREVLDLRAIEGPRALWQGVADTVGRLVTRPFLTVLANDCLDNLPPLTFFQDAVVDESGEEASVFQLQRSVLSPLVDVGRVFGAAAGKVLGTSTLERFALARTLLPEHEAIFREASETLRVVLWQQARIGISQGTDGSELPPALLSRQDRHVLKGGFRSILRLIEFTADSKWLDAT